MTIPSPSVPSQDQNLTITRPSPTLSNICHRIFKTLNSAVLCQKYAMVGSSVWICHLQRTWMNYWDCLKTCYVQRSVYQTIKAWFVRNPRSFVLTNWETTLSFLSAGQSWRWQLCDVLFRVPRLPSPDKTQTQVPSLDNESAFKNTVTSPMANT